MSSVAKPDRVSTGYRYVILRIDQRPARIERVSERVYRMMGRLGWFANGKAEEVTP